MPGKSLTLFGAARDPKQWEILLNRHSYTAHLSKGTITTDKKPDAWGARVLRLPAEGLVVGIRVEDDVDLREALTRISKQKQEMSKECERTEAKLSNSEFMAKAPEDVVVEWKRRVVRLQHEMDLLANSERQLQEMMK
jgi:valyl-tRNA synthetase